MATENQETDLDIVFGDGQPNPLLETHTINCEIVSSDAVPKYTNVNFDTLPKNLSMPASGTLLQMRPTPVNELQFTDGERRASIDYGGGVITYHGDLPVAASAKMFFDAVFQNAKPRCETCRWFENEKVSHRTCNCPKMKYGYINCRDRCEEDSLSVEDDEGWGMVPGPRFGCVHHKERSSD